MNQNLLKVFLQFIPPQLDIYGIAYCKNNADSVEDWGEDLKKKIN
jgi:hypothetical protein